MPAQNNYYEFSTPQFRRLSDDQLKRLHHASLDILERTGVCIYDQEALDLLKKAGLTIVEENRVHIPSHLIEWALSVAPKHITIYDRNGRRAMPLERGNIFFGPGSDCLWVLDRFTGERHRGTLAFIEEGIKVCDKLPNIDFLMSLCIASDIDQNYADRYQMRAMLMNSIKPIIFVTHKVDGCADVVRMAEAVAGGEYELRHKPSAICYVNIAHPLRHNEESLQRLLYMAGKGLPCIYSAVVYGGMTGPVTAAGSFALANAGELVGVLLAQLKREGAPVIISGGYPHVFEMSASGFSKVRPYFEGARPEMAHYYDLPAFGLGGTTSSKVVDAQAGAQAALTLLVEAMSGANIIHDVGYTGQSDLYSLQQLVICNELIDYIKSFMTGMEINDETLALDLIDEIGPHGHYLETEHTVKHFREEWYPVLFDTSKYEIWEEKGRKTVNDRANDMIDSILTESRAEPLPEKVQKKIDDIVNTAAGKKTGR
jgi:trimethylamine---corrinoid protein Co-methyltransferase